jgi:hypothetical protein
MKQFAELVNILFNYLAVFREEGDCSLDPVNKFAEIFPGQVLWLFGEMILYLAVYKAVGSRP